LETYRIVRQGNTPVASVYYKNKRRHSGFPVHDSFVWTKAPKDHPDRPKSYKAYLPVSSLGTIAREHNADFFLGFTGFFLDPKGVLCGIYGGKAELIPPNPSDIPIEDRVRMAVELVATNYLRRAFGDLDEAERLTTLAARTAMKGQAYCTLHPSSHRPLDFPGVFAVAIVTTDKQHKLPLDDYTAERLMAVVQRVLAETKANNFVQD
jgi:hypothetical protein